MPAKNARKSASSTVETSVETMETKKRNVSLTGLANFLNEQYSTSTIADDVRIKFKPVPRKPSKKFNIDTVSTVSITKCPGLTEFMGAFEHSRVNEKGEYDPSARAAKVDTFRKHIFDFDARATLDIVHEYEDFDKPDDEGKTILISHLMRNLDLPRYKPVKALDLCELIDKYFTDGLYKIKLINQIYPHSVRNAESEAKHGVNTIYLQHAPQNTAMVLERLTDGESVEDIVKAVHKKLVDELKKDKTIQTIIKQEKIVEAVLEGKGADLKFDEIIPAALKKKLDSKVEGAFTAAQKKDIRSHIRDCVRELSRTRTLVNTLLNGLDHNNKSIETDGKYYLSQYKSAVERFEEFHSDVPTRFKRTLPRGFLEYFIETILLCFDIFGIVDKEKKSDFIRQFINTIDTKKRLRFNDTFKNALTEDELDVSKFIDGYTDKDGTEKKGFKEQAERLIGDCPFDPEQLSKFLNNFGKSCISVRKDDRLTRSTYVAMALTVIRYVQSQVKQIFADKIKSKEITIYLVE